MEEKVINKEEHIKNLIREKESGENQLTEIIENLGLITEEIELMKEGHLLQMKDFVLLEPKLVFEQNLDYIENTRKFAIIQHKKRLKEINVVKGRMDGMISGIKDQIKSLGEEIERINSQPEEGEKNE